MTMTPPPRLVPDRPSDAVLVPKEATDEMMNRAVAAMHAAPVDFMGRQGHAAFRAAYAAALAAAPPTEAPAERVDKGPWKIAAGSRDVYSGDFVADVALRISGDFEDEMHRIRYAEWLCETLNRAAAPAAPAEGDKPFGFVLFGHDGVTVWEDSFCITKGPGSGNDRADWIPLYTAPRVTGGRDAFAELLAADLEYDAAEVAWDALDTRDGLGDDRDGRDYEGPEYARLFAAISRRAKALQAATGGEVGNG